MRISRLTSHSNPSSLCAFTDLIMELPSANPQMASLGLSYERFSTRLIQNPVHAKAPKYLDEYMQVDKKDPETGNLTRFIISEPVLFGLEITLNAGFTYGFYDGVLVKLFSIHSGTMIWKKKFPKTIQKGPLTKAETIIIDSIEAIVDGQLMTDVKFGLDLLTAGDYFKPSSSTSRQYYKNLEGLRIELCKYKQAGETDITRSDFQQRMKAHKLKMDAIRKKDTRIDTLQRTAVNRRVYHRYHITHKLKLLDGKPASDEEVTQHLRPPALCTQLYRYSQAQQFCYLWRGPTLAFFDTISIAKTPVPLIYLSWDVIPEVYRQKTYEELSKYDFEHVWSHHLKRLGSKPENEAVMALSNRLRSNPPLYWRSWGELHGRERSRAFQKLQVSSSLFLFPFQHVDSSQGRRCYIDKGEFPPEHELTEGSKEVPIDLEVSPQKLSLVPGAVKTPTTNSWIPAGEKTSKGSTPSTAHEPTLLLTSQNMEVSQDSTSPVNPPPSISKAVPISMVGCVPSASSTPLEEVGMRTVIPITSTPESHTSDMYTFPAANGLGSSDDPVLAVVSSTQHGSPVKLLPNIKTEHKKAPKRPVEFIDLTVPKRRVHKKHSISRYGFFSTNAARLYTRDPKSTVQSFTVNVDNHIPLRPSSAVALETEIGAEAGIKMVKHEPDVECEVGVKDQPVLPSVELEVELRGLEEEAARAATELEDALRVAEARRQMNSVKRRIDQLKGRGRSFI
ncbi:hypothetical protein CJF31_00004258 [Rutstroemia sp. NJR-2017a BVV2]|nr:hypothetical protein CJF31_00002156 [Rutstroemia sp. NJR-2017a BVV2]PQE09420.1 hypothetical protein CJF31_00004258 [Rutstroemia sp. NJR-2017a BVV2]